MADSSGDGANTAGDLQVSAEGITVVKTFEGERFPFPVVTFEITSDRDEPVTIRMVEPIPEDVAPDKLGFHPDYGEKHWTVGEGTVVFEREIEPDDRYETFYGVRSGVDGPETLLAEPTLKAADPFSDFDVDTAEEAADSSTGGTDTADDADADTDSSDETDTAADDGGADQTAAGASADASAGDVDSGDSGSDDEYDNVVQEVLAGTDEDEDIRATMDSDTGSATAADADDGPDAGSSTTGPDAESSAAGTDAAQASGAAVDGSDLPASHEAALNQASEQIAAAHEEAIEIATEHISQAHEEAIEMAVERITEAHQEALETALEQIAEADETDE